MTDQEVKRIVQDTAMILTTLAETDGAPESHIYLALGMDMERWNTYRGILTRQSLITIRGHYVRLTDKGKAIAADIEKALAKSGRSAE